MRDLRDFATFLGTSVASPDFLSLIRSPDSVFWYRAYLEYQSEEKAREEFQKEQLNALVWIGNIVSHSGTMASSFFSNGKMKDNLGEIYLPQSWKRINDPKKTEAQKRREDKELALSFSHI